MNNRVLIWNTTPTNANQLPDIVLGQPNFNINIANGVGIGANSLSNPTSVYSDGTRVYVTDTGNHRVLIWNTIPTVNAQAASVVLGQPNFTSNILNNGGIGAGTFNAPSSVYTLGTRLFVADTTNNRVLIWNTIPTNNRQNADLVLGQPTFVANTINNGGAGSTTMNGPT